MERSAVLAWLGLCHGRPTAQHGGRPGGRNASRRGPAAAFYAPTSLFGANIEVFNYLGTCCYQLGRKDEALQAWKKSLELNPDQERIRKLVDGLSKK